MPLLYEVNWRTKTRYCLKSAKAILAVALPPRGCGGGGGWGHSHFAPTKGGLDLVGIAERTEAVAVAGGVVDEFLEGDGLEPIDIDAGIVGLRHRL